MDRANAVAQLRCVLVNGEWDDFEAHIDGHEVNLPAQPKGTRPHDAKPKKAVSTKAA